MSNDVALAVVTALRADTAISALVVARVHRRVLPMDPVFPAITVTQIDDIADMDTNTIGYASTRIQCTTWASSDGVAQVLSSLIRTSLHRTINTLLTAGSDGVYVVSIKDAGSRPDVNPDIPLYMYHRDFMITYDYK